MVDSRQFDLGQFDLGQFWVSCFFFFGRLRPIRLEPIGPNRRLVCVHVCLCVVVLLCCVSVVCVCCVCLLCVCLLWLCVCCGCLCQSEKQICFSCSEPSRENGGSVPSAQLLSKAASVHTLGKHYPAPTVLRNFWESQRLDSQVRTNLHARFERLNRPKPGTMQKICTVDNLSKEAVHCKNISGAVLRRAQESRDQLGPECGVVRRSFGHWWMRTRMTIASVEVICCRKCNGISCKFYLYRPLRTTEFTHVEFRAHDRTLRGAVISTGQVLTTFWDEGFCG